jgi:hypothetical protein
VSQTFVVLSKGPPAEHTAIDHNLGGVDKGKAVVTH